MDISLTLKPFNDSHFPVLKEWITGGDMLFQFAGTEFKYPITNEQVFNYRITHTDRPWYIAYRDDGPVAFGELIPQEGDVPRLARLLIGEPAERGKGLGVVFIKALIGECRRLYNSPAIELYVWDGNLPAIRCYEKCGFSFLSRESLSITYNAKAYLIRKMRHEL